jgi:hypothetical protein
VIPALLGIPLVEGVVGGVVGSVANCFAPSTPPPASSSTSSSFTPYLNNASATAAAPQPSPASPTGTMRSDQWGQMQTSDLKSWMTSLAGKHVNATDATGRTISGVVSGAQQLGNTMALNIGGHLVSLSQLSQISWSPSTV